MLRSIAAPLIAVCLALAPALPAVAQTPTAPLVEPEPRSMSDIVERAHALVPLETLLIARDGRLVVDEGFRGNATDEPTNIKSASKSIISALVGVAIDKGILDGPDQKIAPLLRDKLPDHPDPRIHEITIGNLLSMQAGLGRMSGPNYGRWVASRDWVRFALEQPFAGEPGGGMLYSTANTHILSAILTRKTGRSTLELAREWLSPVEGFAIASWDRNPRGIYFGGNQMAMTPKSLLAFGEFYRSGGKIGGRQVLSAEWIKESWKPRTRSVFSGERYGYGWFITEMKGHEVNYAWGFGGQMLYVVPSLGLTVVMTSDDNQPSARNGHRDDLHDLMRDIINVVEESEG